LFAFCAAHNYHLHFALFTQIIYPVEVTVLTASIPQEAEWRSARIEVLLDKLRAELLAADVLRMDRETPTIRIGPGESQASPNGRIVRWTIYLVTPDQ
jgi:hypothetical protein